MIKDGWVAICVFRGPLLLLFFYYFYSIIFAALLGIILLHLLSVPDKNRQFTVLPRTTLRQEVLKIPEKTPQRFIRHRRI